MIKRIGFMVAALVVLAVGAMAQGSGIENAQWIGGASYIDVRSVQVSSGSGAALFSASRKRPDASCRNNSAFTIFIGTDSGNYVTQHPNILNGYPVLSSETFKLDGAMSGSVFATANSAQSLSVNVRCIDGLVR